MSRIVAEVTVLPVGTNSPALSEYIAEVEKVLRQFPAVKSMLTPMSTILEGEWDEVFAAIKAMHEQPFRLGIKRVATRINIDDRRDKTISMESKLQAVQQKMSSRSSD